MIGRKRRRELRNAHDSKPDPGLRSSIIGFSIANAFVIGYFVFLFCIFDRRWHGRVSYILIGIAVELLLIGYMAGWWNRKRFFCWCVFAIFAGGSILAGFRYDAYLEDITLPDYFDYTTFTPFMADSLAQAPDEEPALRFTDSDRLPKMDGATALYPVYAAFAQATYPDSMVQMEPAEIREIVACNTTTGAYRSIVDGKSDIIFVAGPSAAQESYAKSKGVDLVYTPIGREAFVFFVHPDNPVEGLTLDEIRSIYAGEITRWNQLGVWWLGRIRAYQREEGSGSQTALKRFVMQDTPLKGTEKELIQDSMGGMVEVISDYRNHRNAIGYSFRFYCTALMKNFHVKLLAVNGIAPTVENIENGTYPLASSFYAVTRSDADENTLALLNWICGPQGQALVKKTGYTPIGSLPEENNSHEKASKNSVRNHHLSVRDYHPLCVGGYSIESLFPIR